MYDRKIGDEVLTLEASGALQDAALIMRDRETNSWWSMMRAVGIGGTHDGTPLPETSLGEKVQWKEWVTRHPNTKVLVVEGETFVAENAYLSYFQSDKQAFDHEAGDDRLPGKAPIYTFRFGGKPYAIAHTEIEGGLELTLPDTDVIVSFFRETGASVFANTAAFRVTANGERERLAGFDTYWYVWITQNRETVLLP